MKIKTSEILPRFKAIEPGLKKTVQEQSEMIHFYNGRIVSFNGEICIFSKFNNFDFDNCSIPANIIKFLEKAGDEIDINVKEKFEIKKKRGKASFAIQNTEINFEFLIDVIDHDVEIEWKPLPKNFNKALGLTEVCTTNDITFPALTCIYFNEDQAISSDKFRAIKYSFDDSYFDESLLIQNNIAKILKSYDIKEYFLDENWMYFADDDNIFCCKIFNAEFPNVESIFEEENDTDLTLPNSLSELLDTAIIFQDIEHNIDKIINIKFETRKLTIKSDGSFSNYESTVPFKWSGKEFSIDINPIFLKEAIKYSSNCSINEKVLKLETEDFIFVVALNAQG